MSRYPGCTADLAVDGVNSVVLEGTDTQPWAEAVETLVRDTHLRERLGEAASRTISRRWTIEHSADAFVAGLRLGRLVGGNTAHRGARS